MERANRITVQAVGNGYLAVFHRTHKVVGQVMSADTKWVADTRMNRTAQREMFRVWMMDHSTEYGIQYDAEDRRTEDNQMPRKYEDDRTAMEWAAKLVTPDICGWVEKMRTDMKLDRLDLAGIESDSMTERGGWNGRAVNAKYGSGAWAYADIKVIATLTYTNAQGTATEGYVSMVVNIVSGQLKKPSNIGEMGYTYTAFRTEAMKDLQSAVEVDFPKEQKPQTPDTTPAETAPQADPTPDTTDNTQDDTKEVKGSGKGKGRRSKKGEQK